MLGTLFALAVIGVGLLQLLHFYFRQFVWGQIDRQNEISVKGKLIVVTGANAGIGKTTAQELAERGATVILACRNEAAAREAILDIYKKTSNGKLIFMKLDLSSLDSVRAFANDFKKQYTQLDILICNAGVITPAINKAKSQDGHELHFGVNHLGHFLLTNLLLEPIKKAAPSRIVIVSSLVHNKGEIDFTDLMSETKEYKGSIMYPPLYANSKLANALFNKELGKRLKGTGVQTYALCPGIVMTGIASTMRIPLYVRLLYPVIRFMFKTPLEGCQTTLFCSLSKHKDVVDKTGEFYQHCGYWEPKDRVELKDADAAKLWAVSEKLVGL